MAAAEEKNKSAVRKKLVWSDEDIKKINKFFVNESVKLDLFENYVVTTFLLKEIYKTIGVNTKIIDRFFLNKVKLTAVRHRWIIINEIQYDLVTKIYDLLVKKYSSDPNGDPFFPERNKEIEKRSKVEPVDYKAQNELTSNSGTNTISNIKRYTRDENDLKNDSKIDNLIERYDSHPMLFWIWYKNNSMNFLTTMILKENVLEYIESLKDEKSRPINMK